MLAARAMLMKADIMLLDEPTNHLDVKNVAWLEEYLTHLPDVTSMVVSHDSGFLDHVCTGIIHYENRKLKHYKVSSRMLTPVIASLCNFTSWKWHDTAATHFLICFWAVCFARLSLGLRLFEPAVVCVDSELPRLRGANFMLLL